MYWFAPGHTRLQLTIVAFATTFGVASLLAQSPTGAPPPIVLDRVGVLSGELRAQTLAPFSFARLGESASPSAAATLVLDRPSLALSLDGGLARDDRSQWTSRGLATAAWYAPTIGPLRFAVRGTASSANALPRWRGDASLSYAVGRSGAWISAGADRTSLMTQRPLWSNDTVVISPTTSGYEPRPTPRYAYGVWRQLGGAVLSVSVDAHSLWRLGTTTSSSQVVRIDSVMDSLTHHMISVPRQVVRTDTMTSAMLSRAADAEARLVWARSRLSVDLAVGHRSLQLTNGRFWSSGEAAFALDRRLALVVGAGTADAIDTRLGTLFAPALDRGGRSWMTLGVRVSPSALFARPRLRETVRPVATAFEMVARGSGLYEVLVTVPAARTVEVSGDFTSWTPVALAPRADGRWSTTIPITAGTHHINLRVDGDRWVAPPGTTQVSDDFSGVVGVVVVR